MESTKLIPIATLLETKVFKLGEVIIQEGQAPTHFYFVNKGRCKLVKEQIVERDTKTLGTNKIFKTRRMVFSKQDIMIVNHQE